MKLLVAIDLSPASAPVIAQAKVLARALSARICLLHVTAAQSDLAYCAVVAGEFGYYPEAGEVRQDLAQRYRREHQALQELSHALQADGHECVALLVSGSSPADTIVREAARLEVAMIVMGAENKGLLTQLLEGSTSKDVIHQSRWPIVVVPLPDAGLGG